MNPKVNVIVPVYNVAPYLTEFFESLMQQTFQDFDVWVVNDKSTDCSLDIIENFASRFLIKFTSLIMKKISDYAGQEMRG